MATDLDKLLELADDTITHKKLVLDNSLLMAEYLMKKGKIELGIQLLRRGCTHDNSKFDSKEFRELSQIMKGTRCFVDPNAQLSTEEIKAIKYHWKHNSHHPEYYDDNEDMSELDILEMVCDWFARSIQFNTDFIPFVKERQSNRFHFRDKKFEKILKYCTILQELYTEKNIKNNNDKNK